MSASFYLNANDYPLNAGTITLRALDSGGNQVAPIITTSSIMCANLRAEFANNCTGVVTTANVALALKTDTGSIYVAGASAPSAGMYLKAGSPTIGYWDYACTPGNITAKSIWSDSANALTTTGASVNVSTATPGIAGDVLTLISPTEAAWLPSSGGGSGNITSNVLTITNDPQNGYVLTGITSNTAQWATPSAGNLTGPVTSVGLATTIASTGVAAQKYGNSTSVGTFTVNAAGQLTQAANVAISFPSAGNLTGPITSVGLATSIGSQTGTGSVFVVQNTPTLTTPVIGVATGTSLSVSGQLTSTVATGTAPLVVSSTTRVSNLNVSNSALADVATLVDTTTSTSGSILYPTFVTLNDGSNQGVLTNTDLGYVPSVGQIRTKQLYLYGTSDVLWLGGTGAKFIATSGAAVRQITIPNIGADSNMALSTNSTTQNHILVAGATSGSAAWTNTITDTTLTMPRFPGPVVTPITVTASSGSAINITSSSTYYQFITGTSTQRINMPSTSVIGQSYFFVNNSTQNNSVYGSAGGAPWVFNAGNRYILIQTVTNGTGTTDWAFIQILS